MKKKPYARRDVHSLILILEKLAREVEDSVLHNEPSEIAYAELCLQSLTYNARKIIARTRKQQASK